MTRPDGSKEYRIADHLGSARVMVNNAGVLAASDYEPFGEPITVVGAVTGVRKGFIDKEKDSESGNYNTGMRQLEGPRMISIDPKWEMFRGWTPYQYSFNNPLRFKDPGGENPFGALVAFAVDYAVEIGIGLIVTGYVVHQITRTEYFGTNRGLRTSVAMPVPRRFDQYAVAVISSLNAMDAVGFVDAMHAMAEEYNDSEPGEPYNPGGELPPSLGVEIVREAQSHRLATTP